MTHDGWRTPEEIQAQYETLIRMAEEYDGHDNGRLGILVGAAYAIKWVVGTEDGSEFINSAQAHTTEQVRQ